MSNVIQVFGSITRRFANNPPLPVSERHNLEATKLHGPQTDHLANHLRLFGEPVLSRSKNSLRVLVVIIYSLEASVHKTQSLPSILLRALKQPLCHQIQIIPPHPPVVPSGIDVPDVRNFFLLQRLVERLAAVHEPVLVSARQPQQPEVFGRVAGIADQITGSAD
jgi:hypothetical protein